MDPYAEERRRERDLEIKNFVHVVPTDESQLDKGIDHPLRYCPHCGTVWRSHKNTNCPSYCNSRRPGERLVLDDMHMGELMHAISDLHAPPWDEDTFRDLLHDYVRWYDKNSRQTIQACYEAFRKLEPNPKIAFAIDFFKEDYKRARDEKRTYCPLGIEYWLDYYTEA